MKKPVLIGLLIAAALFGLITVGAAVGGHHRGDTGSSRQAAPPMDCIGPITCG
ncbi:hypothetical protein AB0368_30565 [Actinoplanes sp. NPDC051475]|uniref:hypothetical protein n=1 Tax=Actinoplanes sp. NPDC051475 TaxID=3157225 RepID=UPI00344C0550